MMRMGRRRGEGGGGSPCQEKTGSSLVVPFPFWGGGVPCWEKKKNLAS